MARRLSTKTFCAYCSIDAPEDYVAGRPFICWNCQEKNNTWIEGWDREAYRYLMDWCMEDASRTWCIAPFHSNDAGVISWVVALAMSNWIVHTALLYPSNYAEAIRGAIHFWRRKHDAVAGGSSHEDDVIYEFEVDIGEGV